MQWIQGNHRADDLHAHMVSIGRATAEESPAAFLDRLYAHQLVKEFEARYPDIRAVAVMPSGTWMRLKIAKAYLCWLY